MQYPFTLIRHHISKGSPAEAFNIYTQIRRHGNGNHQQHAALIPILLKACSSPAFLNHGKTLHAHSIKYGFISSNVLIGTSLITMYSKSTPSNLVVDSRKLFDEMSNKNAVTWNAMIGGYARSGDMASARFLFEHMPMRTSVTWTEMIDGFARSGDIDAARCFFDQVPAEMMNVVTWTVMVDGYASNGMMDAARALFEVMPERNFFVWSSMIAGYCKKGQVKEATHIFERITVRNLVNWNALIAGYAQNGLCEEAFEAFERMQDEGFQPDEVTVASMLSACAQSGSLDMGKKIHDLIVKKGIKLNQFVLNGLVDMYAKCGDIGNATRIFEAMPQRNDACWNAMISGLAVHGRSSEALGLFRRMEESEQKPNEVTFLSILSACAHGGYVNEGLNFFSKMKEKYGLVASIEHYGCLVDLLGRAGKLRDAYNFVTTMPMKPNDVVWGALLGACKIHSETDLVEYVQKEVGAIDDPEAAGDDSHYVLLSNIYAASDRWEKAENMRLMMVANGIQKEPGCSLITHWDK